MPPQLNGPEQRISNPWVTGSTPVGGTMITSKEQPYIYCGEGVYEMLQKALQEMPSTFEPNTTIKRRNNENS